MSSGLAKALDGRLPRAFLLGLIGTTLLGEFFVWAFEEVAFLYLPVGLVLLALAWADANKVLQKSIEGGHFVDITGKPAPRTRALVVAASPGRGAASVLHCVRHAGDRLERLYVLYTDDQLGENARHAVMELLTDDVPGQLLWRSLPEEAAHDPRSVFHETRAILEELHDNDFEPWDILIDMTGGSKAITAGMALAGAGGEMMLGYVTPRQRNAKGAPVVEAGFDVRAVDLVFDMKKRF